MRVVAGILRDSAGRVLLAQRRAGSHLAGMWEFPGGKIEPGESPLDALRRELREELGVEIGAATELHRVPWTYSGQPALIIEAFEIVAYRGTPHGREAQAIRWVAPTELKAEQLPAADRPLIGALLLDRQLTISAEPEADDSGWLDALERTLASGRRLILLRSKQLDPISLGQLAQAAFLRVRACGGRLLISDHLELVDKFGLDGAQLSAQRLRECRTRPLAADRLLGASCHSAEELALAVHLDCDYATLSPVQETRSHPDSVPLGWSSFAALARACALPCFALGGLKPEQLAEARAQGAFGVAGIGAFWSSC